MPNLTPVTRRASALVVLSGGQDSTTCLFWALTRFDRLHAMVVNYGQRHARELQCAELVAHRASAGRRIDFHRVDVPGILRSRSPLTMPAVELEQYENAQEMARVIGNRVETTFVPLRNPFFLTLAANLAVSLDCFDLITGVCEEDNANYPDCRRIFLDAQEDMIEKALGIEDGPERRFRIHTPLMYKSKAETVLLAIDTPGAYSALAYTHTAYDGQYPPVGKDHASLLRAQGFAEAGWPDPLVMRAVYEGRMAWPTTKNYEIEMCRRANVVLAADARAGYPTGWRP